MDGAQNSRAWLTVDAADRRLELSHGWSSGGDLAYHFSRDRLVIATDGNVGIGTTIPAQKLHVVGNICATGTIGACSDGRFKKNVRPVNGALELVSRLQGVQFDWKPGQYADHGFAEGRQVGFIAQDVEQVLPQVVSRGSDGFLSVDYGRLTPLLVEAIRELRVENERELRAKDAEIADLRERLARLEAHCRVDVAAAQK
jgi:hypothetical protein